MNTGVALQAAERWPILPGELGKMLARHGNIVHKFHITQKDGTTQWVATFPIKEHWAEASCLRVLEKTAQDLLRWVDTLELGYMVYMPRVGCGAGRLSWEEVQPVLEKYFDSRFTVVSRL